MFFFRKWCKHRRQGGCSTKKCFVILVREGFEFSSGRNDAIWSDHDFKSWSDHGWTCLRGETKKSLVLSRRKTKNGRDYFSGMIYMLFCQDVNMPEKKENLDAVNNERLNNQKKVLERDVEKKNGSCCVLLKMNDWPWKWFLDNEFFLNIHVCSTNNVCYLGMEGFESHHDGMTPFYQIMIWPWLNNMCAGGKKQSLILSRQKKWSRLFSGMIYSFVKGEHAWKKRIWMQKIINGSILKQVLERDVKKTNKWLLLLLVFFDTTFWPREKLAL